LEICCFDIESVQLAMRMLYSAEPISAHEALTGGLVSQVCADAAATHAAALKLTNQIAAFSPAVMQLGKSAVLKHVP
jgi:enoyl-CoA hydratase/carnithine racemase